MHGRVGRVQIATAVIATAGMEWVVVDLPPLLLPDVQISCNVD